MKIWTLKLRENLSETHVELNEHVSENALFLKVKFFFGRKFSRFTS